MESVIAILCQRCFGPLNTELWVDARSAIAPPYGASRVLPFTRDSTGGVCSQNENRARISLVASPMPPRHWSMGQPG